MRVALAAAAGLLGASLYFLGHVENVHAPFVALTVGIVIYVVGWAYRFVRDFF
jgi:hypothetical protein